MTTKALDGTTAETRSTSGKNQLLKQLAKDRTLYLLVTPILVVYSLFSLYPIAQTFYMSFFDAKIVRLGDFMGLENYFDIIHKIR